MTLRAVIFDIGNVLLRWDPEAHYDRVLGRPAREALFAAVDLEAMNLRVDAGEDLAEVVEQTAAAHPEHAAQIRIWHDDWLQMCQPDIPETAVLLRALRRRGMPVHALSNFGVSTFALAQRTYPVLREFDRLFVSGHLGLLKPDPAIYAHVEAETGLAPEALLFIDDRADNVAAAQARGWNVHHFRDAEALGRRLVELGALDAGEVAPP
jgi:2-haloacid dehalogenase